MVKIDWLEHAQELFGEQRSMTEEERKINKEILERDSVPVGINVFDELRTYVRLKKSDINFVDKRAEQEWDAWMKLDSFHGYEKNWNGYDAEPISDKLIYFVKNLIFELDIIPEIFPVADGSIQLEYDQDGKYLEFQIYEDKHMTWYYKEGDMDQEGTCPEAKSILINQCVKGLKYGVAE